MTPTQKRIYELLLPGLPLSMHELFVRCIDDELANMSVVKSHIAMLRRKISREGEDIVFRENAYRLVRRIQSS